MGNPSLTTEDKEQLDSRSSHEHEQEAQSPPPREFHGVKWFIVVTSLISVTFLWGLDGTITADMQVRRDSSCIKILVIRD